MASAIATNVVGTVSLKIRVDKVNATSPHQTSQYHLIKRCVTKTITKAEMDWRYATAVKILCAGSATTYGSYSRDAIGHLY